MKNKLLSAPSVRFVLLAALFLAFARLTFQLDAKDLWWDESLTLQRSEQPWLPLLLGHLPIWDRLDVMPTIDQHPFFYYILQGLLIRSVGNSEYALRYLSVMAATLFVPSVWVLSRWLVAQKIAPPATSLFALGFAAISPYYLWFGQEARAYALWGTLSVLSSYWLLRVTYRSSLRSVGIYEWVLYFATTLASLITHYFAFFHLPIHALNWFLRLYRWNRRVAVAVASLIIVLGAATAAIVYYRVILSQHNAGTNFSSISMPILFADLLNSFSLGLSVNIADVWIFDVIFAVVAVCGAGWLIFSKQRLFAGGWIVPAMIVFPVVTLLAVDTFLFPAYMTSRHMSLIGGAYYILLGIGLAWIYRSVSKPLVVLLALIFLTGIGYSTGNYFTQEIYAKEDMRGIANYLSDRLTDQDVVLVQTPFSWRIFDYYFPVQAIKQAVANGADLPVIGVPRLFRTEEVQQEELRQLATEYRRIWLVVLGDYGLAELNNVTEPWLNQNLYRVQTVPFRGNIRLTVSLYLPSIPAYWEELPMQSAVDVVFGDQIKLAGYDVGAVYDGIALPINLYWQTEKEIGVHYKYTLRLARVDDATDLDQPPTIAEVVAMNEREPYEGAVPTIYWAPGQTIVEFSELPATDWRAFVQDRSRYRLVLEVYDATTLQKLPVTAAAVPHTEFMAFLPLPVEEQDR